MLSASNIHDEVADRTQATSAGGIGLIQQVVKRLGHDAEINRSANVLKSCLPPTVSDHVRNRAYHALAGGTCLEHLELRRHDEAYLTGLGARRIPDPTTAGDSCRRFHGLTICALQQVFNDVRVRVWRWHPGSFFAEAILDADGTMVETTGECEQRMDVNDEGRWGYRPLTVGGQEPGLDAVAAVRRLSRTPSGHPLRPLSLTLSPVSCCGSGLLMIQAERRNTLRGRGDLNRATICQSTLMLPLATRGEPLYLANRSGNRPSQKGDGGDPGIVR